MTTIKTLISTVALLAASTGFAQTSNTCSWFPKGEDGPGVIGKRYAEASFGVTDVRHTAHNICDTGISANVPIIEGIEVSGGYSYSWLNTPTYGYGYNEGGYGRLDDLRTKSHSAHGTATFYRTVENGIKPFISTGLLRSWTDENGPYGYHSASNATAWGVAIGAEFAYKWVAVTPTIGYQDDFKSSRQSTQLFTYGTEINTWITPRIGTYLSLSYIDWQHSSEYNWSYGIGVRVRF